MAYRYVRGSILLPCTRLGNISHILGFIWIPIDGFEKVKTMPFKPNSMFGFIKTTNSFHGVDIINADIERDAIALVLKCIVSDE